MAEATGGPAGTSRPVGSAPAALCEAVAAFAHPRRSGSAGADEALAWIEERLRALGVTPVRDAFTFDDRPLSIGLPCLLGAVALAFVVSAAEAVRGVALAVAWGGAGAVVLLLNRARHWMDRPGRVPSANVFAASGSAPQILLMAHWDSKSQWVSFRGRTGLAAAAGAAALSWTGIAALASPPPVASTLAAASVALLVAAAAVTRNGNASPGALDNASGVVAVLEVLRRVRAEAAPVSVGVVFTGAEEEGLVGATRFARTHPFEPDTFVLNLDTVGGQGPVLLTRHDRAAATSAFVARLEAAAERTGHRLHHRLVPFPAAVDSAALARAGIPAVTLASGTAASTYCHLHRPSDALAVVDGAGLARVVDIVVAFVRDTAARSA